MTARQAAVLTGAGRAEVVSLPVERPGPGDVVVAVEGCGVCGSNLPVWEGRPWFDYPLAPGAPGHEAWGEVVALGRDVTTARLGDRVALLADAAFATTVTVPVHQVVPLPAALAGTPFPGEAFGAAFNVARRSRFAAGQRVAVVGVGFIGAVVVALAARAGADVAAVSRRPSALEVARRMGAATVHGLDDPPDGAFDVVVEAVGSQAALDLASPLPGTYGRLVLAGFHQDGPREVDLQSWGWRGLDVVNAHERDPQVIRDGIARAATAVADGVLEVGPLLTHSFPLDRLGDALDAVRDRPDGFLKAVVLT